MERTSNAQKYYFTKEQLLGALAKCNSQSGVAKQLGCSQMAICRLFKKHGIVHDGRVLSNADPVRTAAHSEKMKGRPGYWKGKTVPRELAYRRTAHFIGKPAWNSGKSCEIESICQICNQTFKHNPKRKRILCSRECTAVYMSRKYMGKLTGKDNPNFGNGEATKLAHQRGCYKDRVLPDHARSKFGYYKGIFMRSSWEIAYAKFLDAQDIIWKYECTKFQLSDGRFYTPDFYFPADDKYVEIKGHWWGKSKLKFEQFLKEYPHIQIEVIREEIWKQ